MSTEDDKKYSLLEIPIIHPLKPKDLLNIAQGVLAD